MIYISNINTVVDTAVETGDTKLIKHHKHTMEYAVFI